MTEDEKLIYWSKYAKQNAKYERNGILHFRKAIASTIQPVISHVANFGAQSALDSLDILVSRNKIEAAFTDFYFFVGKEHKLWADKDYIPMFSSFEKKKERGVPPIQVRVAVAPADAGLGAGFFNPRWLQRLKNLVYGEEAAKRVTSITNTIKKKLRAVLGRAVKEEVRPSVMARRIQAEMNGKFSVARSKLIARTESTYIANLAAKESAMEAANAVGMDLDKIWVDTRDALVRDSHWVDGNPIPAEDKFKIGDKLMDCPGDPAGGAEECCNCRCTHLYVPRENRADIFPDVPPVRPSL
jgi:hypothetical protein